jgi:hypothetical protein
MNELSRPNPPWMKLRADATAGGYLSFHYSDDLSALPVRWVTKPGDNKSDPNLETGTYGLFSTCSPSMRRGVVKQGKEFVFFCTRRGDARCLTGFYRIGWYAQGPLGFDDYCLAADRIHFVERPMRLPDVDEKLGTNLSHRFRGMRSLSPVLCVELESLLTKEPNCAQYYCDEIDRLERFNFKYSGFRYVSWKQKCKFNWKYAGDYLKGTTPKVEGVQNSSASDLWACTVCSGNVKNKALLKRCPHCGELGSLKPT